MAEASEEPKRQVTRHQFYFETPLYEVIKEEELTHVIYSGEVDAYSAVNNIDTTYSISYKSIADINGDYENLSKVRLMCKRKSNDYLYFFVYHGDGFYVKVGQAPSLATIQFGELGKKYDKFLSNTDLKLFKKAIGLAAHGTGAGSFVYLRRIFEGLIKDAYETNKKALGINEESFFKQRMTEKVETLKPYLPSQLVDMKEIYSVLSRGVHELSEEVCLRYFEPLKLSIELILDQKIEEQQKAEKDRAVRAQLQAIQKELKSSVNEQSA